MTDELQYWLNVKEKYVYNLEHNIGHRESIITIIDKINMKLQQL